MAESPPPMTATGTSRQNAASQTAQYVTPLPCRRCSDGRPSWRAVAPVATMTDSARYSSSPTKTRERPLGEVDARDVVSDELGAEALGLAAELGHHLRAEHAVRIAGIVLDVARDHELAAPLESLDDERLEVGARSVERGGVARRPAADDDQFPNVRAHGTSKLINDPDGRSVPNSRRLHTANVEGSCRAPPRRQAGGVARFRRAGSDGRPRGHARSARRR